ncbi:cache domain-containing protein, partial [Coprobacillus cateniformis]|uniref:cache domain-containing protein n=1 Tax=Coprobacillus cateniformis TaxID=100884 RepID=UPI00241CB8C1
MRNPLMKKSIIITIISLVIFSFLATLYTDNLSRNLYDETNEFLKEIAVQTASSINNRMNENITQLDTIALMIHTNNTDDKKLLDYLNELAIQSNIKRFGIADLAGNVKTSDRQVFNIKDRDYFQKSLHGEKVKSNSMEDFVDGEQIIVYSVPLYNKDNQINGVFFATYDTVKLSKTLDNASFNNTGYSFIFNESGDIILLSTQAEDVKNIKAIQDLSQQKDIKIENIDIQGSGIISFTDHNNSHNYFTYANIKNNDWLVASVFPQEVVTDRIQNLIITAFITWLLIGLGSAFLLSYTYFIQKKNKLQLTKLAFEDALTQHYNFNKFIEIIYVFLTIFLYLLKCPQ